MKRLIALALCCLATHGEALETGLFIGGNIGNTELELDRSFRGTPDSTDALAFGFNTGYLFENSIITKLNITDSDSFSLFGAVDRHSLRHIDLQAGYQFTWKKFRLTPSVGLAKWELKSKQGQLFNSGPEAEKRTSGNDAFLGIALGVAFTRRFQMNIAHKQLSTDFGGYDQTQFEFLFRIGKLQK